MNVMRELNKNTNIIIIIISIIIVNATSVLSSSSDVANHQRSHFGGGGGSLSGFHIAKSAWITYLKFQSWFRPIHRTLWSYYGIMIHRFKDDNNNAYINKTFLMSKNTSQSLVLHHFVTIMLGGRSVPFPSSLTSLFCIFFLFTCIVKISKKRVLTINIFKNSIKLFEFR